MTTEPPNNSGNDELRNLFPDIYYDEADQPIREWFFSRLDKNAGIREEWITFKIQMDSLTDPAASVTPELENAVLNRIKQQNPLEKSPRKNRMIWLKAAAVILLLITGGLAMYFLSNTGPAVYQGPFNGPVPLFDAALQAELNAYLGRSEMVLMSFNHLEEDDPKATDYTFEAEIRLAGQLSEKASELTSKLSEAGNFHLAGLVRESEIALKSLARVPAPDDFDSIWIIQQSTRNSGLQERLSMEKFRLEALASR